MPTLSISHPDAMKPMPRKIPGARKHLYIPDTQAKPGAPADHMKWIGNYIVEKKPEVIVHLGDHWDMPSLSQYDYGRKCYEGRRYTKDIDAGNNSLEKLMAPIDAYNRRAEIKYEPRLVILRGNHEHRIARAIESDAKLDGLMGYHHFNDKDLGWYVHDFLEPVEIDGVTFAHYFYQPNTGKPYAGTAHTKLKNIGMSFVQGHIQGIDIAYRTLANGDQQIGLVAGSCYLHDEEYKGPQANGHWRGVVMAHEVSNGSYNPMMVSLEYLRRRYA